MNVKRKILGLAKVVALELLPPKFRHKVQVYD
jgi:hypothetical protein